MLDVVRSISDLAKISYTRQKQALGLGHAIYQAKDFVGDEPFAALLADDIVDAEKPALKQMVEVFDSKQRDPLDVLVKKYAEFRRKCP